MNGDPNLDLNWLRSQGHPYEPYADYIVQLLAQRQAQKDRADNNADSIELLERRLDDKEAELAMLRGELREAKAALSDTMRHARDLDAEARGREAEQYAAWQAEQNQGGAW